MKPLLIKLTHGLSELDISIEQTQLIQDWLLKKYITKKDNVYKFHSKYRAGTLGLVQKGTAYLHVIGENVKDLFIAEGDLGNANVGDLIIAQRLLGKRGTPSAKIVEIVGREQSYSVAYIIQKQNHKSLVDLKTEFPIGAELTPEELNSYSVGDVLFGSP